MIRIGLTYDTKEDYGFTSSDLTYTDFISLATVGDIKNAIEMNGYEVDLIGNIVKLNDLILKGNFQYDLIFNVAEGFKSRNREGLIPALLEVNQIPYTGSDAFAQIMTLNKHLTKLAAMQLGIPTPKFLLYESQHSDLEHKFKEAGMSFPVVIKPNAEGGSMGVQIIERMLELLDKVPKLFLQYQQSVLIEEYIDGMEITVPIIGNDEHAVALDVVAEVYADGTPLSLYTKELKYLNNTVSTLEFKCPSETKSRIKAYALLLHKHIGCLDYSRADFRLDSKYNPYFLEMNPLPSLCRQDSFELCGKMNGLEYFEIIGEIIHTALKRYNLTY